MTTSPEDYSNFSLEAIQKSLTDMVADVKKQTGASDEEINFALSIAVQRFMDVNCFELEDKTRKD